MGCTVPPHCTHLDHNMLPSMSQTLPYPIISHHHVYIYIVTESNKKEQNCEVEERERETKSLRVVDEVHVHLEGVGGDKNVRAELGVELLGHLKQQGVEDLSSPLQLRHALPVSASLSQLRRNAPQRPRPRHHHPTSPQLIQPLRSSINYHLH